MAALASTSLSKPERRAVDRLVALLRKEYADELRAVWLYGSRARGGPPGEDSDVDLLVVTARGEADAERIRQLMARAAQAQQLPYGGFSVIVRTPRWVAERRAIDAFFIQEVDRDRVVLAGGEIEPPADFDEHEVLDRWDGAMKPRSAELLELARERLRRAHAGIATEFPDMAVEPAYYAMLHAARAALSERDLFVRTHRGTWDLFWTRLVDTGELPAALHTEGTGHPRWAGSRSQIGWSDDEPEPSGSSTEPTVERDQPAVEQARERNELGVVGLREPERVGNAPRGAA